jgi:DNA-binding NtrC family response regulator
MMACESSRATERRSVPRRILLAEDDAEMRKMLSQALSREGHLITECPDGVDLLLHLAPLLEPAGRVEFDLVISDIRMPGLTGMEILEGLTKCGDRIPVILITAFGTRETYHAARQCGVAAMLDKPFEIDDLLATVGRVLGTS